MTKDKKIYDLCTQAYENDNQTNGILIDANKHGASLYENNIFPHELTYSELLTAASALTSTLLYRGANSYISIDHKLIWMWCAELLLGCSRGDLTEQNIPHHTLYSTVVRSSLAETRQPDVDPVEISRAKNSVANHFGQNLIKYSGQITSYLAFPCLEAQLKILCSEYVEMDGKVIKPFKKGKNGRYKEDDICSTLSHLMRLYQSKVAPKEIANHIEILEKNTSKNFNNLRIPDLFGKWRNESLHGQGHYWTIGGTVLGYCLMISLNNIKDKYADIQKKAVNTASRLGRSNVGPDMNHYYKINSRGVPELF